jgi:hypothetical protein
MRQRRVVIALFLLGGLFVLGLLAWILGSGPSQAADATMHNCPQAGKWAIAVWDGDDGTDIREALATCGQDAVGAVYSMDRETQGWSRWFADQPEMSTLPTLDKWQGVIAFGAPSASPAATLAPPADQGAVQGCPQAGKWAIAVWNGQNAVGVEQALASCGPGAVSAAYYLDPGTGSWLRWFRGRADISTLETFNNLQGFIALGSAGFTLGVDKFGEGTVTSSPGGIDCGTDCTYQAEDFPAGTSVVLTASTDSGSAFSHWSGCDSVTGNACTVAVDADKIVFAAFAFDEMEIAETTKVLDEATMDYLIRQEDSTYYFDPQAEAVANLEVGDVIVSNVGQGLLRKVAAINVAEEEIAVETTDALLEEAIERGTIIFHQSLTPADLQSTQASTLASSVSGDIAAADVFDVFDFELALSKELIPGLQISGSHNFDVDVEVDISIDWFTVKELRFAVIMDSVTELGMSAEAGVDFDEEAVIFTFEKDIPVTVGPFPVLITPGISIAVGIEGSAQATVESQITLTNTSTVGVHYWQPTDTWSEINNHNPVLTFYPPDLSAQAGVKAYIAAEVSVQFYRLFGPFVIGEVFLELEADLDDTPWWSLYGGIGANAGFRVKFPAIRPLEWYWPDPWEEKWLLAQAETPPPTPEIPTPETPTPETPTPETPTPGVQEITIQENSGDSLTDYQVLVELNGANFNFSEAEADGSDVRFYTDSEELDYWIEEWDSGDEQAKIWIEVPSIPANGETTIEMHYGDAGGTSSSDGDATFLFFDDFESGTGKWDALAGNGSSGVTSAEQYGGTHSYHWWCPYGLGNCKGLTSEDSFSSDVGIVLQAKGMISSISADSVVEAHLRKAADDSGVVWAEVSIDGPTGGNDRFGHAEPGECSLG